MKDHPTCYGRLTSDESNVECGDGRIGIVKERLDQLSKCEYGDESNKHPKIPCTSANSNKIYCNAENSQCERFVCGLPATYQLYENNIAGRNSCNTVCYSDGAIRDEIPGTPGWYDDPQNLGVHNELGNPYLFVNPSYRR